VQISSPLEALDGDFLHTCGKKSPRGPARMTYSTEVPARSGMQEWRRRRKIPIFGLSGLWRIYPAIIGIGMAKEMTFCGSGAA